MTIIQTVFVCILGSIFCIAFCAATAVLCAFAINEIRNIKVNKK